MNAEERFRKTVKWRTWKRPVPGSRLGDMLVRFMENHVEPRHGRFEKLDQVWEDLLGEHLCGHCRIVGLSGSKLEVKVDSPAYMHQLTVRKAQLLAELNRRCRSSRIREIRIRL